MLGSGQVSVNSSCLPPPCVTPCCVSTETEVTLYAGSIINLGDKHSGAGCEAWTRGSAIAFPKLSVLQYVPSEVGSGSGRGEVGEC